MKTLICATVAATALAGTAIAATKAELRLYDLNGDGYISDLEWSQANESSGKRAAMDTNADGMIDREEYDRGEFLRADRDGDGRISAEEYDLYN